MSMHHSRAYKETLIGRIFPAGKLLITKRGEFANMVDFFFS